MAMPGQHVPVAPPDAQRVALHEGAGLATRTWVEDFVYRDGQLLAKRKTTNGGWCRLVEGVQFESLRLSTDEDTDNLFGE